MVADRVYASVVPVLAARVGVCLVSVPPFESVSASAPPLGEKSAKMSFRRFQTVTAVTAVTTGTSVSYRCSRYIRLFTPRTLSKI
eukprot:3098636-Prymnesium_polylepis.1